MHGCGVDTEQRFRNLHGIIEATICGFMLFRTFRLYKVMCTGSAMQTTILTFRHLRFALDRSGSARRIVESGQKSDCPISTYNCLQSYSNTPSTMTPPKMIQAASSTNANRLLKDDY